MNGIEVFGAIAIVPAIYAVSRYYRSSALFLRMLAILAFGFVVGLGVRQLVSSLSEPNNLKKEFSVGKQAMGIHDLPSVAVVDYTKYALGEPKFTYFQPRIEQKITQAKCTTRRKGGEWGMVEYEDSS
jgi:hypothetical protein